MNLSSILLDKIDDRSLNEAVEDILYVLGPALAELKLRGHDVSDLLDAYDIKG